MYVCLSACLPSARRTFRNRRFPQLCASLDSIPHSTLRTYCNNRWNIKRRKMLKSLQNVRNSLKCLKCLTSLLLHSSLLFISLLLLLLLHPLGWNCAMDMTTVGSNRPKCNCRKSCRKPIKLPGCISESLQGGLSNQSGLLRQFIAVKRLEN